ncbi:MAG: tatB 1 [Marmoricola sp.]|jgi:sec-independent protein translocase protein TatB|nr:tatB 1 [Marmoricola sp.]
MQDPSGSLAPPVTPEAWEGLVKEACRIRPGQKYLVAGSAAHPLRVLIESLSQNDPRRIAAQIGVQESPEG